MNGRHSQGRGVFLPNKGHSRIDLLQQAVHSDIHSGSDNENNIINNSMPCHYVPKDSEEEK
ncbi:Protein SBE2 [Bienertia sinuspersici]